MKTNENLAKIVSSSTAFVLCSAMLLLALMALLWGTALPALAHVMNATATSSPVSGPANTPITVIVNSIPPPTNSSTTVSVILGYGPGSGCTDVSSFTGVSSSSTVSGTSFNGSFNWPSSGPIVGTSYSVCAEITGTSTNPVFVTSADPFMVTAPPASITFNPTSGSTSTTINVTGNHIVPTSGTTVAVQLGYGRTANSCSQFVSVGNNINETVTNSSFTDSFSFPSGTTAGTYPVCAQVGGLSGQSSAVILNGGNFTLSAASTATVSVDSSSYTVGDNITVSGTHFAANTSVTVELQSSDGATTKTLGTVTTDTNGAFTQSYTVPKHPLNSVVAIVTNASGTTLATSSSFTVNAKASTSAPAPAPAPAPAAPAPAPQQQYFPPAPAPAPAPTDTPVPTPTAVPTDTPVPTPTVAPTPAPVATVAPSTPFSNLMGGKLPLVLGIGLATLIGLGILFVVGRLVLSKYLAPAPPNLPPNGASPWTLAQGDSLQGNMGVPFETMPLNSPYGPNAGFGLGNGPQPQQVPFNDPFAPVNAGFGSGPGNGPQPQQVPFNGPYPPVNAGFIPDPGNTVPFNGPYAPGNGGSPPANGQQVPFASGNNWFPPPQ